MNILIYFKKKKKIIFKHKDDNTVIQFIAKPRYNHLNHINFQEKTIINERK